MAATIFDIAKECGTSKTTVSKVLTGNDERISAEKRRMIHEAMMRLNYKPSAMARGLSMRRSNVIGFVTSRVAHMVSRPYYAGILDAVLDQATDAGQRLTMYNTHRINGYEIDQLMFADGHCDGLIVLGAPNEAMRSAIAKASLPCIVVNGGHPDVAQVSIQVDNKRAGYDATRHLIELGHTRIGYVHMKDVRLSTERLEGYTAALVDAGLPMSDDLLFPLDYDPTAAYSVAGMLRARPELGVTALFCVNDEFALAALQGLRDAGYRVPDAISVIGIDGVVEGERCFPKLTTMSQSLGDLGKQAVKSLMKVIDGDMPEKRRIDWQTSLVVRGSSSAPVI